jgi:hypothetical protein
MALEPIYDSLTYGDETRDSGDTVGLPHDEDSDGVPVGQAVMFDGSTIAAATGTDPIVGVLSNYPVYGEDNTVDQDQDATVKTAGTVKAEVESGVSAGDGLDAGTSTNGVFDTAADDADLVNAVALTDAKRDDRPDGGEAHYAEVLLK